MTEIKEADLINYIGKEITMKQGSNKSIVVFSKYNGWIKGFDKTNHSFIEILIGNNKGEFKRSYFIE